MYNLCHNSDLYIAVVLLEAVNHHYLVTTIIVLCISQDIPESFMKRDPTLSCVTHNCRYMKYKFNPQKS